jgi:hypothetical protein
MNGAKATKTIRRMKTLCNRKIYHFLEKYAHINLCKICNVYQHDIDVSVKFLVL